jgi:hypothetical protein
MWRYILTAALLAAALDVTAAAQTPRQQIWPGVWISLPKGVKIERQRPPISEVLKQTLVSSNSGTGSSFYVDFWRLKKGEPSVNIAALAKAERLWMRDYARKVTVRVRGNSYSYSYVKDGRWIFGRNVRFSSRQLVKASLGVPANAQHAKETRRMVRMIESISLRR